MSLSKDFMKIFLEKEPFADVIGQHETKKQVKSALLMGRNIIIVGPSGIGKTTLAKNVAKLLPDVEVTDGCLYNCDPNDTICPRCKSLKDKKKKEIKGINRFIRVQGSPDLTEEDLLGDIDPIKALNFGPLSIEAFTPGKIFKANRGVLFFDELNRCSEKLQNSLLQVLEEKKSTIGSYDVDFPADFIFIGTMNPKDTSTETLSDVFLDRFDVIYMGYPESLNIEKEIVIKKGKKEIDFPEDLLDFIISFVWHLRESDKLEKKPSVRASIGLYERAQANAYLNKRKSVVLDDIKEAVLSVMAHRIELKPSVKYLQNANEFVEQEFKKFMNNGLESKDGDYR